MRTGVSRWLLGGLLMAVACDDGPGEGQATVFLRAVCEFAVRCHAEADVASCLAADAIVGRIDTSIAAGRVRVDANVSSACLRYIRSAPCTTGASEMMEDLCRELFAGTVQTGGACFSEIDCADRAPCLNEGNGSLACKPGECGSPGTPRTTSGPCDVDDDCATGHYCAFDIVGGPVCVRKVAAGQACHGPGACPDDSACVEDDTGTARCLPLPADGTSCRDGLCANLISACDPVDGTCKPLRALGESCADRSCIGHLICVGGTCQHRVALGQPCPTTTDGDNPCARGRCLNGTCQEAACTPSGSR